MEIFKRVILYALFELEPGDKLEIFHLTYLFFLIIIWLLYAAVKWQLLRKLNKTEYLWIIFIPFGWLWIKGKLATEKSNSYIFSQIFPITLFLFWILGYFLMPILSIKGTIFSQLDSISLIIALFMLSYTHYKLSKRFFEQEINPWIGMILYSMMEPIINIYLAFLYKDNNNYFIQFDEYGNIEQNGFNTEISKYQKQSYWKCVCGAHNNNHYCEYCGRLKS